MKTLFSLFLTLAMTTPALAQGKVRFVNDSLHLVYFSTIPGWLHPGDAALAGQPYVLGAVSDVLTIELWAGTSSTALSRVAVTDFTGQASSGTWNGLNVTLNGFPGGALTFFQILIYDLSGGGYPPPPYSYHGETPLFTVVTSSTIAYNSLVNHNSPANSTWADGTYNMDFLSPGFRGAIVLWAAPEPSVTALGGLALAMLLLHRRIRRRPLRKFGPKIQSL